MTFSYKKVSFGVFFLLIIIAIVSYDSHPRFIEEDYDVSLRATVTVSEQVFNVDIRMGYSAQRRKQGAVIQIYPSHENTIYYNITNNRGSFQTILNDESVCLSDRTLYLLRDGQIFYFDTFDAIGIGGDRFQECDSVRIDYEKCKPIIEKILAAHGFRAYSHP